MVIGDVPATWFGAPELAERNGTLLYLHGGAWCVHLPALYCAFAATLSAATGMRVLLVDYRLAPEHPFPAAVDDCLAVYRALAEGPASRPRVVAGDSAGGNLTLVTLMRVRDARLPLPDCAVLLSPATDIALGSPSMRYNANADPMFSDGLRSTCCPTCTAPDSIAALPLISPLHGDWTGLPPLYFLAGSTRDAARRLGARARSRAAGRHARRASTSGRRCRTCFPLFAMLPEARQALADIVAFIGEHARHAPALPLSPELDATRDPVVTAGLSEAEPTTRGSL